MLHLTLGRYRLVPVRTGIALSWLSVCRVNLRKRRQSRWSRRGRDLGLHRCSKVRLVGGGGRAVAAGDAPRGLDEGEYGDDLDQRSNAAHCERRAACDRDCRHDPNDEADQPIQTDDEKAGDEEDEPESKRLQQ